MTARKKTARKKTARKKTARKKTARRKASAKKTGRKKSTRKKKSSAASLMGDALPKSLSAFGRQMRRDLNAIEREIETAGRDTRRSLARVVRDVSHQLGALEERGERAWRSRSRKAQRDIEALVRRMRRAMGT